MCRTTILTKQLEIRAEFQHVDIRLPGTRPIFQEELLKNYLAQASQRYQQNSEYVVSFLGVKYRAGEGFALASELNKSGVVGLFRENWVTE